MDGGSLGSSFLPSQIQSCLVYLLHAGPGDAASLEFFHDSHCGEAGGNWAGKGCPLGLTEPGTMPLGWGRQRFQHSCNPHSISQTAWTCPTMCPWSLPN